MQEIDLPEKLEPRSKVEHLFGGLLTRAQVLGYQWWVKYQPVSAGLDTRSGTEEDFRPARKSKQRNQ